jgi:hypothetical protein
MMELYLHSTICLHGVLLYFVVSIASRKYHEILLTVNHDSHLEVVYHMIPVTHEITGTQVFSGLQNELDITL